MFGAVDLERMTTARAAMLAAHLVDDNAAHWPVLPVRYQTQMLELARLQ
jgi:hypothetical protein